MEKELKHVILLNYVYIGMTLLSSLTVTPLIVRGLGQEQYGQYTLVFTTIAYLAVSEFGIGNIIVRNVKKYILVGEEKELSNFLFTALMVYIFFSIFIVAVNAVISLMAPLIFSRTFDTGLIDQFRFMFHIMTANTFVLFFRNYFFAVILSLLFMRLQGAELKSGFTVLIGKC